MATGSSLLTSYPSAPPGRRFRSWCLASALAAVLVLAACGDDEDDSARTTSPSQTAPGTTTQTGTGTTTDPPEHGPPTAGPQPETSVTAPDGTPRTAPESPEERPGGAGDETPARSHAVFTGRAGRVGPRLVKVPPFISIRVELRSADGRRYSLRFGTRSMSVGRRISATSTIFAGLRPGRQLTGSGPAGRVAVEASAEPGP